MITYVRALGSRGQRGQLPPTFTKNRAKLVNDGQILDEIWFLPLPHFWVLTPHFSGASEGPVSVVGHINNCNLAHWL